MISSKLVFKQFNIPKQIDDAQHIKIDVHRPFSWTSAGVGNLLN